MFDLKCSRCGSVSLSFPERLGADDMVSCGRCHTALFPMAELRRIARRPNLRQVSADLHGVDGS